MIVSLENPTPHWVIYLQILVRMIVIRAMIIHYSYDFIGLSELVQKIQVVRRVSKDD